LSLSIVVFYKNAVNFGNHAKNSRKGY